MAYRYEYLAGYQFSDCYVRRWNIIGFAAQKWSNSDSLEQRDTAIFFYYPDEPSDEPPDKMWAFSYLGESTGVHGCAAFKPNERWIFVTDDGEVYVVGEGDDDWENPIS